MCVCVDYEMWILVHSLDTTPHSMEVTNDNQGSASEGQIRSAIADQQPNKECNR